MNNERIKNYKTLHAAKIAAKIAATIYRKQAKYAIVSVFRTTAKTRNGRILKERNGAFKTVFAVFLASQSNDFI